MSAKTGPDKHNMNWHASMEEKNLWDSTPKQRMTNKQLKNAKATETFFHRDETIIS